MTNFRIYVDTSVFGGILDKEFAEVSKQFFKQIQEGKFILVSSAIVQQEIDPAPLEIKKFFSEISGLAEIIEITREAIELRESYLKARIVSPAYSDDALHVALATVSNCSMIVSWNFKHIVHYDKIALYNTINVSNGFNQISIFSPMEVIDYE